MSTNEKYKKFVIDYQDETLPKEVREDIENYAADYELSQSTFAIWNKKYKKEEDSEDYPHLSKWLSDNQIEECIIWYWW